MLDVLLVRLNYEQVLSADKEFDLATSYLASSLRAAGFSVQILDASLEGLSYTMLIERLMAVPARVIGLSVWLHRLVRDAERLVQDMRNRGIVSHITMGSHSPTFLYKELLAHNPGLDSVICGEGERTLVELVAAITAGNDWLSIPGVASLRSGELTYVPRAAENNLDSLPMPALDYAPVIKERGQFMSVLTSRGCYGRCTFCSTSPFYRIGGGKTWRAHTPERVLQELKLLKHTYGFSLFGFRDDNFIGPGLMGRQRAQAIAEGIIKEGLDINFYIACRVDDIHEDLLCLLKQAGLARVFLGVESGSQQRLDAFNKGVTVNDNLQAMRTLAKLGIPFTAGYIMFAPDTSWEEFQESRDFLSHALGTIEGINDAVHDMFNPVEVLPGTKIAEDLRATGRLKGDHRGYRYDFVDTKVRLFYKSLNLVRKIASPLGKSLEESRRKERQKEQTRRV